MPISKTGKPVILVVDDTHANLKVLVSMLNKQGYKTRPAINGQVALTSVIISPPDLVLLDINMPDMNGYEVCRLMKQNKKTSHIPIIFISASDETTDKVKAFEMGGIDYITKPFKAKEVLARVETHLTLQRLQQDMQEKNKQLEQEVTERKSIEENLQIAYCDVKQLNDRLQEDLALAYQIQQSLLPPPYPNWSQLDIACFTMPAREIGGDFYRYHAFHKTSGTQPPNRYAFAVGDVSGKGTSAALLMAACLSQFDASLSKDMTPEERLIYLDKAIFPYTNTGHQNCAMCYMEIDMADFHDASCQAALRVVNAGCIPPYIKRHDGSVEWIEIGGIPLGVGISHETGYYEYSTKLAKGDVLVLMSDGIVEAMNISKIMFGFNRLMKTIESAPHTRAIDLLEHVKQEIMTFIGDAEPHDDMTIMVVQIFN